MATKTKAELEQEIAELKSMIEALKGGATPVAEAVEEPVIRVVESASTDVEIVYTSHSMGHLQGSQFSLDANVYGERFTLSRPQFDELVGKYRQWFVDGILAVSSKNIAVAASKRLPVEKDNGLTTDELVALGTMKPADIEKLWNKVKYNSLKQSIVSYYKEQFEEGTEGYRNRERVDLLNRLTDGAFDYEVQILGGRPIKIEPIDLVTATDF